MFNKAFSLFWRDKRRVYKLKREDLFSILRYLKLKREKYEYTNTTYIITVIRIRRVLEKDENVDEKRRQRRNITCVYYVEER